MVLSGSADLGKARQGLEHIIWSGIALLGSIGRGKVRFDQDKCLGMVRFEAVRLGSARLGLDNILVWFFAAGLGSVVSGMAGLGMDIIW